MKKMTFLISALFMGLAAAGCGKTLDNADFVEGYEYPDEPVDVPSGEIEPDEIADNQVKVISFNMRTGGADNGTQNAWAIRCEGIPAMMEKENPTVMGVQEALGYQLSFVTDNVPGYDYYGVGRDDGGSSGETMAIFYKTDVVELGDHGTFWLSETPDKVSYGWDAKYRRTATWAFFTVKATGKRFFYVNTHLDNEGSEARKQSIVLICDKMKELNPNGYPSILTADFNSTTDSGIFDPLRTEMQDARTDAPVTDQFGTYNGWGTTTSTIDHIFYSDFTPLEYHTIMDRWNGVQYLSDHYPISALLEFE